MSKLLSFSLFFALACVTGFFCPLGLTKSVALLFFVFFLLSLKLLPQKLRLHFGLLGLSFGLIWFSLYSQVYYLPSTALDNKTILLEGTVTSIPQETSYGQSLELTGGEEGDAFHILLYFDFAYHPQLGDSISTIAHLQSTAPEKGYASGSLRSKRIALVARAYGDMSITKAAIPPFSAYPAQLAEQFHETIQTLYSQKTAPLMSSLLLGFTDEMPPELTLGLQRTGLSHMVSISGMHISFISALFLFLRFFPKRKTAILQIALLFFFAAMTGNGASAIRAAVLCSASLVAPLFRRESHPITSLFTALFLLLLYNPYALFSLSLQFSFAATFGIYLLGNSLLNHCQNIIHPQWHPLAMPILTIAAVSFSATIFTLPLGAYYFGTVSLIAIFMNVLCSWAVLFSFIGGILSLLLFLPSPPLGQFLASLVEIPAQFFLEMQSFFARFPFASIEISSLYYTIFFLFLYALAIFTIYWWQRGEKHLCLPLSLGLLCLSFVLLLNHLSQKNELTYTVLNVGQGQSIALSSQSYNGLIDCGGEPYFAPTIPQHFLSQGISTLDIVVLTHFHEDHTNALPILFSLMKINVLAVPKLDAENENFQEIKSLCEQYGTEIMYIEEAKAISFGSATLSIYPPVSQVADDNEAGLSILTTLGSWDALATGDMGSDTEIQLLKHYELPDLEVLILGHHGSGNSSSALFLDQVKPEIAVASVGANNKFDHPNPKTIVKLYEKNIPLFRTDTMGKITFTPKGD